MWKAAAGTIAVAAVITLGGVANANKGGEKEKTIDTNLERQAGTEEAIDLKKVKGEHAKKIQQKLQEEGFYKGEVDGILGKETQAALREFQEAKGLESSGKLDNQTASALGIELSDIQPVRGEEEKKQYEKKEHEQMQQEPQSGETTPTPGGETMTTPTPSPDLETQSGTESAEDSTSPVSGGETATEETEPTSGQTQSGSPAMGGVETQEDPNVVNEEEIEQQAGTTFDKETIRKVQQALKDQNLFDGEVNGVMDQKTTDAIRQYQRDNGLPVTGQLDANILQSLGVSMPEMTPTPTQP